VSLHWLGPGHTFRTSYAAQDNSPAKQHIITFDIKSSTATYVAPDHPFPAYDRTQQNAYLLSFPKWDEDHASNEESKSLTIVADFSSVDVEVLGNVGNKWFRQSQDNPLTLPLDNSMDDTILLSLVADLTDTTAGAPLVYAYLNDGSIQGWHAEHSKRYIGLLSPGISSSVLSQPQEAKDTEMISDSATPIMANTFGQPDSVFEQKPTAFGRTGFSQQGTSTFGQPSFGQPSFGQASFGQSNQTNNNTISPFSSLKPATGFGTFATTRTGEFGSTSSFSGFGSSASTSHTFSQGSLANATPTKSKSDALSPNISPTITQEASMSDSTTGFGGLSLGTAASETKPTNSMFGSFGTPATTSNQTESLGSYGSGGVVKPASGFGAFGGLKTSGAFDSNGKPPSTVTAFASPISQTQTSSSGFGQTSFGQSAFGQTGFGSNSSKSAFGQPAFGKTSFGTTPTTTMASSSGGFAAFAKAPTNFTSPSTTTQPSVFGSQEPKPQASGGFSAFASPTLGSTTSSPGFMDNSTSKQPSGVGVQESKLGVSGGFAAFASPAQTPFGSATSGPSVGGFNSPPKEFSPFAPTPDLGSKSKLATPVATRTSVFGTPLETTSGPSFSKYSVSTTPKETATRPITMSPPSSPEPKPASANVSPKPTMGGAFANIHTTPSSFQPAVGFGAFGSTTPKDSPFFKKPEQTSPSSPFTPKFSSITSGSTTTPAFGSTSVLGPSKPAFGSTTPTTPTPVKSTTTPSLGGGAFSAFSGSSSPLAVVAGQKKSFSDLLKTGGAENRDPEKSSCST
jgi:nucleoporin NUP159